MKSCHDAVEVGRHISEANQAWYTKFYLSVWLVRSSGVVSVTQELPRVQDLKDAASKIPTVIDEVSQCTSFHPILRPRTPGFAAFAFLHFDLPGLSYSSVHDLGLCKKVQFSQSPLYRRRSSAISMLVLCYPRLFQRLAYFSFHIHLAAILHKAAQAVIVDLTHAAPACCRKP